MSFGLLILRLVVGLTMAAHGAQKLFGWFGGYGLAGTGQFFEQLGFRPGRVQAALAGTAELVGGLFLAAGFLTPAAAAAVAAVMLVAAVSVHISLDQALGISWSGDTWGLAALAAGLIGGAVPLLARKTARPSAAQGAA